MVIICNLLSLLMFPLTLVFLVNNSGGGIEKENACTEIRHTCKTIGYESKEFSSLL